MMQNKEIDVKWEEEIVRETEHYYQGEMQQEERASWLLGTSSALIAIIISSFENLIKGAHLPPYLILVPLFFFFISAIFSVFTLLPYDDRKLWQLFFPKNKIDPEILRIDELLKVTFHLQDSFKSSSIENRLKYHFRSHYLRNRRKSKKVVISLFCLLFGLFSSTIIIFNLLFA